MALVVGHCTQDRFVDFRFVLLFLVLTNHVLMCSRVGFSMTSMFPNEPWFLTWSKGCAGCSIGLLDSVVEQIQPVLKWWEKVVHLWSSFVRSVISYKNLEKDFSNLFSYISQIYSDSKLGFTN